eukprot:1740773-Amphidinium_carterae.1
MPCKCTLLVRARDVVKSRQAGSRKGGAPACIGPPDARDACLHSAQHQQNRGSPAQLSNLHSSKIEEELSHQQPEALISLECAAKQGLEYLQNAATQQGKVSMGANGNT